ncbi:hypothetical protein ACFLV5_03245 [Chloroflexota bacterium]
MAKIADLDPGFFEVFVEVAALRDYWDNMGKYNTRNIQVVNDKYTKQDFLDTSFQEWLFLF